MFTEKQASELWCPMVRAANGKQVSNCTVNVPAIMQDYPAEPVNDHTTGGNCIASRCAMWRWGQPNGRYTDSNSRVGYCGLAGKPPTW